MTIKISTTNTTCAIITNLRASEAWATGDADATAIESGSKGEAIGRGVLGLTGQPRQG